MIPKPDKEERITDIYIQNSYTRIDSVEYILPKDYELSVSEEINYNSEFGSINFTIRKNEEKVLLFTKLNMHKGRYPKDKITDFNKFLNTINKIESYEIIVSKKE